MKASDKVNVTQAAAAGAVTPEDDGAASSFALASLASTLGVAAAWLAWAGSVWGVAFVLAMAAAVIVLARGERRWVVAAVVLPALPVAGLLSAADRWFWA